MQNIFNVMNNVMFRRNLPGYRQLQEEGVGSQAVLYNTERIGVLVARNLNQPMSVSLVKENIRKQVYAVAFLSCGHDSSSMLLNVFAGT